MGSKSAEATGKHEIAEFVMYDMFVLAYILRGITSENNAVPASGLAIEMKMYLGKSYSDRTLRRKLDSIIDIQNWENEPDPELLKYKKEIAQVIYCIFGGRILTTGAAYKKYYFEPCLDNASMQMLNGTVLSNRFLSEEEKAYLLTRMKLLNMLGELNALPNEEESGDTVAPSPVASADIEFPGDNSRFIKNTVILDNAIKNQYQVEITYGIYDMSEDIIDYHYRMENGEVKKYRLNPYALFWSEGHYYLLATYVKGFEPAYMKESGTPVNFRMDRVVDADVVYEKSKIISREKIPKRLKEFFDLDMVFDSEKYCARFPAMRISEHSDLIDCTLECTPWSLQILVDTFGSTIKVKKSSRKHKDDELDYNGRKQAFLEAIIKQVEFENIRDFCLANPEYITPLAPDKLVEAVKEKLELCISKLPS